VIEVISEHIISLGVELECGVPTTEGCSKISEKYENDPKFKEKHDGSVSVPDCIDREYTYYSDNIDDVFSFLRYMYNEIGVRTNSTCGFHIHVKFNDMRLARLFGFRYPYMTFIKQYKEWAEQQEAEKYKNRLTNKYCIARYSSRKALKQFTTYKKTKARYSAINLNSLNIHKTLEIRILPHQKSYDEAIQSIKWLISAIENSIYLITHNTYKLFIGNCSLEV